MTGKLNKKERKELVDLLRRNMLYQTPKPIFTSVADVEPSHVQVRMVCKQYQRIMELIAKAGGWVMDASQKLGVIKAHEERAKAAHGDGNDYDLSHMTYGDLVAIHDELDGVEEMAPFREAIAEELKGKKAADG